METPGTSAGLPRAGVDGDHPLVALGDARRGGLAVHLAVDEGLQRVPPDGPADGEPDVAGHAGAGPQPVLHRLIVRAAAQHDTGHAVAPAGAGLRRDSLAVLAFVEPFDLPDVGLDPAVVELRDGPAHQVRTDLLVVAVAVATDARELLVGGRHEELEQEPPVALVQPVAESLQPPGLAL